MSFYTSLAGVSNAQTDLNVIANNLANAQTTGFKSSSVSFADIVSGSPYGNPRLLQGIGSRVESIDQNFSGGSIEQTGTTTNLAVNGAGFFTVQNPVSGQTYYTRNGNFTLDSAGYMVDSSGNQVQMLPVNASGTVTGTTRQSILVPQTDTAGGTFAGLTVGSTGLLVASYSDGSTTNIGAVAIANIPSQSGLEQVGNQEWAATGLSGTPTYAQAGSVGLGNILSGSLEQSNVDVSTELVNLISAQQYFQANSKAISADNQMLTSIIQIQG